MSESPAEVVHADLRSGAAIPARFHCGSFARRHPRFDTLTDTLRSGRGCDFWDVAGSGIREFPKENADLDASGRGWTGYIRIRNQQVSRSSPLASSNKINNLQGSNFQRSGHMSPQCHHRRRVSRYCPTRDVRVPTSWLPSRHASAPHPPNDSGLLPGNRRCPNREARRRRPVRWSQTRGQSDGGLSETSGEARIAFPPVDPEGDPASRPRPTCGQRTAAPELDVVCLGRSRML